MSGKRILDLIAVFNATREVAQKHIALRSNQLELYSKTSSLAKAIRSQTEAITRGIEKSSVLASPYYKNSVAGISETAPKSKTSSDGELQFLPGTKSTNSLPHINQDSYRLDDNNYQRKIALDSLQTKLPEILLNSQGKQVEASNTSVANLSSEYSRNSTVKDPDPKKIIVENSTSQFDSSPRAILEKQEIPEDVNINLFHSPKVAKLLGGKVQKGPGPASKLKHARNSEISKDPISNRHQDHTTLSPSPPTVSLGFGNVNLVSSKQSLEKSISTINPQKLESRADSVSTPYELRESKVPSSRLARIWNYGTLAVGMFGGVVSEGVRRASGSGTNGSLVLNSRNMDRLVTNLSRMRGAALKLGQMISFQDSKMFPAPVLEVLQRVQDRADYMPSSQRDSVLTKNFGSEWRNLFTSFDDIPLAAASIGQVHRAVLKSNGVNVAVKVQYPGVAKSIDSDLKNLELLLTASKLLPKGLYLDKMIANARTELAWECDYEREAEYARQFSNLLRDETNVFKVPEVFLEASGKQVLTMEFMNGVAITKIKNLSQEKKDWIGTQILRLCLREITEFRLMQTDPNWTNFLFNEDTQKLALLDFGASREYSQDFIARYTQLLAAASKSDRDSIKRLSEELGYLTGFESKNMVNAHITSILTLAEPFLDSSPQMYDFRDQTITNRVTDLIPLMMRERLTPPPEETYSLHRKLSGAFLLCARLGSRVPCRRLFEESFTKAGIL